MNDSEMLKKLEEWTVNLQLRLERGRPLTNEQSELLLDIYQRLEEHL